MGLRHLGRELALKALYQIDIRGGSSREELALLFESFHADDRARKFAVELVEGVERERAALDQHVAGALEHWTIGRLSRVDHNILRIGLYELLWMSEIPARTRFSAMGCPIWPRPMKPMVIGLTSRRGCFQLRARRMPMNASPGWQRPS